MPTAVSQIELTFHTGKPLRAAVFSGSRCRGSRTLEYALLFASIALSLVPWCLLFTSQPLLACVLVLFVAATNVLLTFVSSTRTDTSHHIRFLLAGSNPIGMTGGCSLLLGTVDSILDWKEDSRYRRKHPFRFAITTVVKFLLTPIGMVLMLCEFGWDVVLLRRTPKIIAYKWHEFFSLAYYHNVICPEKSNDIFYADMAYARYRQSPYAYQWVRMRSMVFELQHYKIDVQDGIGVPSSNLFLQSDVAAYQVLKRLRLEEIESAIADYYEQHPDDFVVPRILTGKLVRNARPLFHYLRMRHELECSDILSINDFDAALGESVAELRTALRTIPSDVPFMTWHLLRLIDGIDSDNEYLSGEWLQSLAAKGYMRRLPDDQWRLTNTFGDRIARLTDRYCEPISNKTAAEILRSRQPDIMSLGGQWYRQASPAFTE